jgi:putative hydrolase of the HAD superfamily
MRLLFENYGIPLTDEETRSYTALYRKAYDDNTRAVPGVLDLIKALKPSVSIGVVTNGLHDIQLQKLRVCQAETLADYIVISGDLGFRKPEKAIFEHALSKSGAKPEEAVLIGDSWELDILGASGCGIRTIWINRYGMLCPDSGLTLEVRSFEDTNAILECIFSV